MRETLAASEDYLTARTFGLLRYLSSERFVRLFGALGIEAPAIGIETDLWPKLPVEPAALTAFGFSVCEPDAHLHGPGFSCLVEAKFVGSRVGDYLSQLGREWLLAKHLAARAGWSGPLLLVVSADSSAPRVPAVTIDPRDGSLIKGGTMVTIAEQIVQFVDAMRQFYPDDLDLPGIADVDASIRWTSWHRISDITRSLALELPTIPRSDARILGDVREVLARLGFTPFRGWALGLSPLPNRPFSPWWPPDSGHPADHVL